MNKNYVPADFKIDSRWQAVADETSRRPPLPVSAPGICAHFGFVTTADEADRHREHMLGLLSEWSARIDLDRMDQIVAVAGDVTVKWERHTEFCSFTIIGCGKPAGNMAWAANIDPNSWPNLPADWKSECPGNLVVALKIIVQPEGESPFPGEFFANNVGGVRVGASVNAGGATLETNYQASPDGFMRTRVQSHDNNPQRIGRLVQRLIEIETYRVMTLYAWPDVQTLGPQLGAIDEGLSALAERLGNLDEGEDQRLLTSLTNLARDLEHISAQTHFRLNASLAYSEIVQRRLTELREERIEGFQRLSNFIERRLNPAARTFRAILIRQAEMSERISRTSALLRSRIDVELAQQNQQLLASMDRRARQQFHLQQTVEGLSVVAISYYAIGIMSYGVNALAGYWHDLNVKMMVGMLTPAVILVVYLFIRRLRAGFESDKDHAV